MIGTGIVGVPTKVTRTALENAASIASCVLTTESLVADKPDPQQDAAIAAGSGFRSCRSGYVLISGKRKRFGQKFGEYPGCCPFSLPSAGVGLQTGQFGV